MIDINEDMNININKKKLQSRFNTGGDCAPTTLHSGNLFGRVLTIQFRIFHPFALHKSVYCKIIVIVIVLVANS